MRALIHDPDAPQGLRLGDAKEPELLERQALLEVHAVSLNFGELMRLAESGWPGDIWGWDAAGVITRAAADGSGPPPGSRVVTFGAAGAWAELRAVDTTELAPVPESVDLGAANALPSAGVTALQSLRRLGSVIGRRVLVTGASGGVGRFAVQLAARAGAHVIASAGNPARATGLRELGATEVVVGLEHLSVPVYGVIDVVGGRQLAHAATLLEQDGVIEWVGLSSRQPTTLTAVHGPGYPMRLESFTMAMPFGRDLAYLVGLLESNQLDAQIGWRGSWDHPPEAAEALLARRVPGKAVLDFEPRELQSRSRARQP
jgi:NADPH:quinone reductase